MIHEVKLTHEEKLKMYMKRSKKELASMLIECNRCLDGWKPIEGHWNYKIEPAKSTTFSEENLGNEF